MRVAFLVFNGMTALDLIGIYHPITRLKLMGFKPDLEWDINALSTPITDEQGLEFVPSRIGGGLGDYDMLIVPGGPGTRKLIRDREFVSWLQSAESCKLKISVCTGALLLGAAGFLRKKKATTHHTAFSILREFCPSVVEDERIVDQGDVITAGGVTSSIDLGLYLCEKLAGQEAKEAIRRQIEYRS